MTAVPECIKDAVSARDLDALDDILSFFRTFGQEKLESALWSLGYLSFDNYEQRKQTALAMLRSTPLFPCPFGGRPEELGRYCTEERRKVCPFADPRKAFRLMLRDVWVEKGPLPVSRFLVVEFHFGTLRLGPFTFNPTNPAVFFLVASRYLLEELARRGVRLNLTATEVAEYLLYYIYRDYLSEERVREMVLGAEP